MTTLIERRTAVEDVLRIAKQESVRLAAVNGLADAFGHRRPARPSPEDLGRGARRDDRAAGSLSRVNWQRDADRQAHRRKRRSA